MPRAIPTPLRTPGTSTRPTRPSRPRPRCAS